MYRPSEPAVKEPNGSVLVFRSGGQNSEEAPESPAPGEDVPDIRCAAGLALEVATSEMALLLQVVDAGLDGGSPRGSHWMRQSLIAAWSSLASVGKGCSWAVRW